MKKKNIYKLKIRMYNLLYADIKIIPFVKSNVQFRQEAKALMVFILNCHENNQQYY